MSPTDLTRFRLMCRQYRWLAIFMVVSVGGLLALIHLIFPLAMVIKTGTPVDVRDLVATLINASPWVCYLFGVWSIGRALGQIGRGELLQPAIAGALRRVGLALGIGGVISVFVMTNAMRLMGLTTGGYLFFDVPGMTLGMIGGALFLLGRVMDQAAAAQAELDEMI